MEIVEAKYYLRKNKQMIKGLRSGGELEASVIKLYRGHKSWGDDQDVPRSGSVGWIM